MSLEAIVGAVLGGGLFGSLVSWLTTRHRPQVDRQTVTLASLSALNKDMQEDRDHWQERAVHAERENRQLRADNDTKDRKIDALVGLFMDTAAGVAAGRVPPWLGIPHVVRDLIAYPDAPPADDGQPGDVEQS